MKTADVFNVQNNVVLAFQSEGKDYKMHLLIEDGLIRLEGNGKERIIFLDDRSSYTGESTPTEITTDSAPKKKRSKKKKCS